MRTYIVILSDIPNDTCDLKFAEFIHREKLEYWRYTPLNWIVLTPDEIFTNALVAEVTKAYGPIFFTVLEIDIKDAAGVFPTSIKDFNGVTPFSWFSVIMSPDFVPLWIKEREKKTSL